jgi:membrane protein implicated in regulation of membrane protease activity
VRNSTILFIVAALVVVWFGSEAYVSQQICITTCESLAGLNSWEQGIAVAILPVILVIAGIRVRQKEKLKSQQTGDKKHGQGQMT